MDTKWVWGEPLNNGQYLCAVMGYDRPMLLNWCGYWTDWNKSYENVLYYMNLDDIPMPEGW